MSKKAIIASGTLILTFLCSIPVQADIGASFIAVGQDSTPSKFPLLLGSIDNGDIWEAKNIPNLPINSIFNGTSCTGANANAVCIAAGSTETVTKVPLIAVSNNAGKTWQLKNIPELPLTYGFTGASCTGSEKNAICVAAGRTSSGSPLLVTSTDSGNTWKVSTINNMPSSGGFYNVSCTGGGVNAICVAAGFNYSTNPFLPLLIVNSDGGNIWETKDTNNLPPGVFFGVTCTGSGTNAICVAFGTKTDTPVQSPLIVVSTDGGNNWKPIAVTNLPTTGSFTGASCTGSEKNAVCVATGQSFDSNNSPLLAVSSDGAITWEVKTITDLPTWAWGSLSRPSCTGNGLSAICIVAGDLQTPSKDTKPLLVVSNDGGRKWEIKAIKNLPTKSFLGGASCIGRGVNTSCIVSGTDLTSSTYLPFISISKDGGNTWEAKTSINSPSGNISWTTASESN